MSLLWFISRCCLHYLMSKMILEALFPNAWVTKLVWDGLVLVFNNKTIVYDWISYIKFLYASSFIPTPHRSSCLPPASPMMATFPIAVCILLRRSGWAPQIHFLEEPGRSEHESHSKHEHKPATQICVCHECQPCAMFFWGANSFFRTHILTCHY